MWIYMSQLFTNDVIQYILVQIIVAAIIDTFQWMRSNINCVLYDLFFNRRWKVCGQKLMFRGTNKKNKIKYKNRKTFRARVCVCANICVCVCVYGRERERNIMRRISIGSHFAATNVAFHYHSSRNPDSSFSHNNMVI